MLENSKIKKILFSAYSLDMGGIECSIVNLLNYLVETRKYDITLVLEHKEGILLDKLKKDIKIIEYTPSYNKVLSKLINAIKRVKFILIHKNKYDASFSYATYCKMAAVTSQIASRNSSLWVHSSYLQIFDNNPNKYLNFFKQLKVNNFKNIIFVSNRSKEEFEKITNKKNTMVCNNIIDYKRIESMALQKIQLSKKNICTFLYVGRIIEESKKFSRLLEAAKILKEKNLQFRIIIIGSGKDLKKSKEYVKTNGLDDYINFIGETINPYPYFKIADALVLVSENEGYPVVFDEAKTLQLPIITTDVSDSMIDINNKFGIVCEQNINSIVGVLEDVIKGDIQFFNRKMQSFNPNQYNIEILNKMEEIINERN